MIQTLSLLCSWSFLKAKILMDGYLVKGLIAFEITQPATVLF